MWGAPGGSPAKYTGSMFYGRVYTHTQGALCQYSINFFLFFVKKLLNNHSSVMPRNRKMWNHFSSSILDLCFCICLCAYLAHISSGSVSLAAIFSFSQRIVQGPHLGDPPYILYKPTTQRSVPNATSTEHSNHCDILLLWHFDPVTFYYCGTSPPIQHVQVANVHPLQS